MQRIRRVTTVQGAVWLLGGLLTACAMAGFMCLASLAALETHVTGMPGHIGFSGHWDKRFPVGERLDLAWDRAMPHGYERIYLHQGGELIGSLPESPLTGKLRRAFADGRPVEVRVVKVDPLDPAKGLRVRVSIDPDTQQRQPVAVQALHGLPPLL